MRTVLHIVSSILILFSLCIFERGLHAQEAKDVTIDSLVARVPVLSVDDPMIDSFQIDVRLYLDQTKLMPIKSEIAWSREGGARVIHCSGADDCPVIILIGGKGLIYDAPRSAAEYFGRCIPSFSVSSTASSIPFGLGLNCQNKPDKALELKIDLRSFFDAIGDNATLKHIADDRYELTIPSASGMTVLTAYFNAAEERPLSRICIRDKAEKMSFEFFNIHVNEAIDPQAFKFPSREKLPESLIVYETEYDNHGNLRDRAGALVDFILMPFERLIGNIAIADESLRKTELADRKFFAKVDWKKAKQSHETIGPALRKWIDEPTVETSEEQ